MRLASKIGLTIGLALVLLLLPAVVRSEQLEKFDGYVVHYNALSSDQLPPEVAKTYGFQRSSHRGLLNIAVQKDDGAPVSATVSATVANLAGQRSAVAMREIREGEAVYYLGEFSVAGTDTLNFDVKVQPVGASKTHAVKFNKNYVTD